MKYRIKIFVVLLIALGIAPLAANAVSWSPLQEERAEKTAKGIMVKGDVVCLFQSGTEDIKKEIHVNDVLIVYRDGRSSMPTEVGKIKILSYVGRDYLKGEVIEGEIKAGDVAKKGDVASLVISTSSTCK